MNPLKELLESRQTILRIETQNTIAFLRPVPDVLVWTPCPTARLAQRLRFCQVRFTVPEGLLGTLLFTQIEHESDTLVRTFLKQRASNEHGHAAAIFPDILLLKGLNSPGRVEFCDGPFVALAPFSWRQVGPPQSTRDKVRAFVAGHPQERIIGVANPAVQIPEHDPDDVGVDQPPDLRLALLKLAVQSAVLERYGRLGGQHL